MDRIVYMIIRYLFQVSIWFFHIDKIGKQKECYSLQGQCDYIGRMVEKINVGDRVDVRGYGAENLPKENGFILFSNHQGLFNMLAIIDTYPKSMSMAIKKEMENWVLVKQVLAALDGISVDRSDIKASLKVINQMSEHVKLGRNFVIFPGGTGNHDKNDILDFRTGAFKSAVNACCPTVLVALINSFKPFDISSIKKEQMQVHYLGPIYPKQYMGLKTREITNIVHNKIQEKINSNLGQFLIKHLLIFQFFSDIVVNASENRGVL